MRGTTLEKINSDEGHSRRTDGMGGLKGLIRGL